MINRNIGLPERVIRLLLGAALVAWVFLSPTFGAFQGLALLAAFALFWNSIFGRCYLWKWLGLNTCNAEKGDCPGPSGDGSRV